MSDNVTNFRDVGEWVNVIAGRTLLHEKRLLRGGSIRQCFSPAEAGAPKLIVCLKTGLDRDDWAPVLHHPKPDTAEVYQTAERGVRDWIKAVLSALAQHRQDPVYIHCHAGRDRTGVIIAAILKGAKVPDSIIKEEFLLSDGARAEAITEALRGLQEMDTWLPPEVTNALRNWMEAP